METDAPKSTKNREATFASPRPWWMTAMAVFCAVSVVFLVLRDVYVPHVRDVEVWFGFEVRDEAALLTAPLHWFIFVAGAYGFWFRRPWILPAAAVYSFYIGFSHLIWNETSPNGSGWAAGLMQAIGFSLPGVFFWRARREHQYPALDVDPE